MQASRWDTPYHRVVFRAMTIGTEHDQRCRPVHLLAALSEVDDSIGTALRRPDGSVLMTRPDGVPPASGGGSSYLSMQTMQAAGEFASGRHEEESTAHLLVALIDQADSDVLDLMEQARINPGQARRLALSELAAPLDLPSIEIPPLTPAGYLDRPILDEAELDRAAWSMLTWRQAHLPLDALKGLRDWHCLYRLESQTARKVYRRLRLDADQELSLLGHHLRRVQSVAHEGQPEVVPPVPPPRRHDGPLVATPLHVGDRRFRRHWQPRWLSFTIGWGTWFGNRCSGMKHRWHRLQTFVLCRPNPEVIPRGPTFTDHRLRALAIRPCPCLSGLRRSSL